MKKCSRCKRDKPLDDFNFKKRATGLRQKSCRECTQQEIRNHYEKHRGYYLNKAKVRNSNLKREIQIYRWSYLLSHPCVDCGEKDPIVLDFDHQGAKLANVSEIIRNKGSLQILKKEIMKCVVRCANCHCRKTAKDFNWFKGNVPA